MTIFAGFKPNSRELKKHRVAGVAYDGVVLGDLATPLEIFGRARDLEGRACYDVRVCGAPPRRDSGLLPFSANISEALSESHLPRTGDRSEHPNRLF